MIRALRKNNYFIFGISALAFILQVSGIILMSWPLLMAAGVAMVVTLYFAISDSVYQSRGNATLADLLAAQSKQHGESQQALQQYTKEVEKTHAAEQKRLWVADGVAAVTEILRANESSNDLFDHLISFVVKHLHANQGGLFVAEQNQEGQTEIVLKACYAYDRKKFLTKKFAPGEGLVGQCYLEGETIYLTQLSDVYITITSGLGGASPRALVIVPLKIDGIVTGIIEIASFHLFEPHQIEFIEKLSAICAATLNGLQINERTRVLLAQSQMYGEQIKAQEEVMRQSMEELMATQEEMRRKEAHLQSQTHLMEFIIDNIPYPVFVKDENGFYTLVNKAEAAIFKLTKQDMVGFNDSKFVRDADEVGRIRTSDKRVVEEQIEVHFPEQSITFADGQVRIFKTSKIPFINQVTGKTNILGVSVDLTDVKNTERKLSSEINALKQLLMADVPVARTEGIEVG